MRALRLPTARGWTISAMPASPGGQRPAYRNACPCRKPETGMIRIWRNPGPSIWLIPF